MRVSKKFTEDEDNFIHANIDRLSCGAIAENLGRHPGSVSSRTLTLGLREKNRTIRYFSPEEDEYIKTNAGRTTIAEIANHLGRTSSTVRDRGIKFLGCNFRYIKAKPSIGPDGYKRIPIENPNKRGCDWHREHVYVVEQDIGRNVTPEETIHHIDLDKRNNERDNLHLFANGSQHSKAHWSLRNLAKDLLHAGIIYFDRNEGVYKLCETSKRKPV